MGNSAERLVYLKMIKEKERGNNQNLKYHIQYQRQIIIYYWLWIIFMTKLFSFLYFIIILLFDFIIFVSLSLTHMKLFAEFAVHSSYLMNFSVHHNNLRSKLTLITFCLPRVFIIIFISMMIMMISLSSLSSYKGDSVSLDWKWWFVILIIKKIG